MYSSTASLPHFDKTKTIFLKPLFSRARVNNVRLLCSTLIHSPRTICLVQPTTFSFYQKSRLVGDSRVLGLEFFFPPFMGDKSSKRKQNKQTKKTEIKVTEGNPHEGAGPQPDCRTPHAAGAQICGSLSRRRMRVGAVVAVDTWDTRLRQGSVLACELHLRKNKKDTRTHTHTGE